MIFLKTLIVFGQLWLAVAGENTITPEYTVSLPDFIHVFVGSCALVPCAFNISTFEESPDQYGLLHAIWIKGGSKFGNSEHPVVFNGTTNATQLFERVKVIGDLRRKNCSTVFYNVNKSHQEKYFFRTETNFTATFIDKYFYLSVEDSPASPYVSGPSEVSEGSSMTLNCSAAAPCPYHPPTITWSHDTGNITTHTQYEEDGRRNITSLLTFTASRSLHGREVFCSASYSRQNQSTLEANGTAWRLNVLFPPEVVEASVSPSGVLAEGSSVTLSCNSSEANPPVLNYTWFRKAQTSSSVDSGPNITLNISSNNAGIYYCRAEHPQGAKKSATVELKIEEFSTENNKTTLFIAVGATAGSLAVLFIAALSLAIRKKSTTSQEEDEAEEIHYGEIDFSKSKCSQGDSNVGAASGQGQQETEYAEVRLPGRGTQTAGQAATDARHSAGQTATDARESEMEVTDMEELYAKVKK
ncbi:myelin-associated glycoprotein-like isoform X2 [Engraulis encrasicolus]|uniref:myelin-associated glycoprotein-like isoform X2 n=1 Tax=Engraulis encrasicolus TaxID=184585 RepID=UPI002FD5028E